MLLGPLPPVAGKSYNAEVMARRWCKGDPSLCQHCGHAGSMCRAGCLICNAGKMGRLGNEHVLHKSATWQNACAWGWRRARSRKVVAHAVAVAHAWCSLAWASPPGCRKRTSGRAACCSLSCAPTAIRSGAGCRRLRAHAAQQAAAVPRSPQLRPCSRLVGTTAVRGSVALS